VRILYLKQSKHVIQSSLTGILCIKAGLFKTVWSIRGIDSTFHTKNDGVKDDSFSPQTLADSHAVHQRPPIGVTPTNGPGHVLFILCCLAIPDVKNAIRRVFYGLAGERSQLMKWPDPSPARSLSLVVGYVVGGDLVIKESLVSLHLVRAWDHKPKILTNQVPEIAL